MAAKNSGTRSPAVARRWTARAAPPVRYALIAAKVSRTAAPPAIHGPACHLVSGDADFLVEAVVPSLAVYEEVLLDRILAIEPITSARSVFALRTVLNHGPLPLDRAGRGSKH